jgi:L-fuconolactonase
MNKDATRRPPFQHSGTIFRPKRLEAAMAADLASRNPSRRRFLACSAAALALPVASSVIPATLAEFPPLVDTHVHLWDLTRFRLPWLAGAKPIDRSYTIDDYRAASRGLGVVKAVYMEVDLDPSQQLQEAEFVVDLIRKGGTPLVAAIVSGRPGSSDFAAYLKSINRHPEIKGIRRVLHGPSTPRGTCLDASFIRDIRLLGEVGLSFDLCMRSEELPDAAKLIAACPKTRFILDHCGNPSVRAGDLTAWRTDLARIAELPNVSCKVSGIVASAAPGPWTAADLAPIVDHVLDTFGPDRVVFGGDWPVCTLAATLREWVDALRTIVADRPEAEVRKLFHDNAAQIYHLV